MFRKDARNVMKFEVNKNEGMYNEKRKYTGVAIIKLVELTMGKL